MQIFFFLQQVLVDTNEVLYFKYNSRDCYLYTFLNRKVRVIDYYFLYQRNIFFKFYDFL